MTMCCFKDGYLQAAEFSLTCTKSDLRDLIDQMFTEDTKIFNCKRSHTFQVNCHKLIQTLNQISLIHIALKKISISCIEFYRVLIDRDSS